MTLALSLPSAAWTAPNAEVRTVSVPPLTFAERRLANGLRVFSMPDDQGSTVAVQVWYGVGSKNDPQGRSGFAHMFEHLMFKQTRNLPAEGMDRLTEDVGGENNASTNDDYTEFNETAPANQLERLLWAEAERMGALVVDEASFTSERHVVEEELRTDAARPYGDLFYRFLPQSAYRVHPYARPTLGTIADLDASTAADVRAFHALYYRPDNAVLVVSGRFDPKQLDAWIDRYFAPLKAPRWAIPRVAAREPARREPRRYTLYEPNTPLPAVTIGWLVPPSSDPDQPVLQVIDTLLSGGESSRLFQSLVYRQRIAAQVETIADLKKDVGSMTAVAILAGGRSAADGEAALRKEVADLRDRLTSAAELDRAKTQLAAAALRARETAAGRAQTLAESVLVEGDPRAADRQLAAIRDVTAADVQRVARKFLGDETAVTIHYLPAEQQPTGTTAQPALASSTVVTQPLVPPPDVPMIVAAGPGERLPPPLAGPPIAPRVPVPVERRLANGLRVVVAPRRTLPLAAAVLVVSGGSAADPAERAGLSTITADLLTKGTATRSATQIAETIEALGGSIDGGSAWDGQTLDLAVTSDRLEPAMAIFADVALHPAFAPEELERSRAQALDGLAVTYKNPAALARLAAARAVFASGSYGHPAAGTPRSLQAITREEVRSFYAQNWHPERATLVLSGDVDPEAAFRLAEREFGEWRGGASAPPAAVSRQADPPPRTIVVDLPGTPQSAVVLSRRTIARSDPRYYPALVANTVLGSGFSSRLNQEVRIKRGLAYGSGSGFDARLGPGPLSAVTQTANTTVLDVIELVRGEMRKMGTAVVPPAELSAQGLATRKFRTHDRN